MREKIQRSASDYVELIELNKLIKKKICQGIRDYEEQQIKDILEGKWSTRMTRKAIYRNKSLMTKIKDRRGTLIHNRKEIVKIVTQFYENQCPKKNDHETQYYSEDWVTMADNNEELVAIVKEEVTGAIKQLKRNKAPGPDGIESATINILGESLAMLLTILFNNILNT